MIGPLVRLHPLDKSKTYGTVAPVYVPIAELLFGEVIFEVKLCYFLDNIVVSVASEHY